MEYRGRRVALVDREVGVVVRSLVLIIVSCPVCSSAFLILTGFILCRRPSHHMNPFKNVSTPAAVLLPSLTPSKPNAFNSSNGSYKAMSKQTVITMDGVAGEIG